MLYEVITKRKKFFEDNLFEAYAYSAQLQAQLTEMPQVLDDLISTATTDEDENQAYRITSYNVCYTKLLRNHNWFYRNSLCGCFCVFICKQIW